MSSRTRFATLMPAAALVLALGATHSAAYNPPDGPTPLVASMTHPKAHGIIILRALDVLRGDERTLAADFYEPYLQELLDGARQADTAGGEFTILGHAVPKNSFTHFYNPATEEGFVLDLGEFNFVRDALSLLSLAPWMYFTLKGPHPSVADMADWYYAQAVQAMRQGNSAEAMTYMGYVLHFISDATVPQHVTDEGAQKPGSQHQEYEDYCDLACASPGFAHAQEGGFYRPDGWTPSDYVKEAAGRAQEWITQAKTPALFGEAAARLIPDAERYCAGLLDRFFRLWDSEDFTVVVVTVDRVRAVRARVWWHNLDFPDQADFYAYVTIADRTYRTGVVDGRNDMRPNALLPYAWVFPRWISGAPAPVEIEIAVWDEDVLTADDQAHISPQGDRKELRITFDPVTGEVCGDVSASPSEGATSVHSRGNHYRDVAEIWLTVENWP